MIIIFKELNMYSNAFFKRETVVIQTIQHVYWVESDQMTRSYDFDSSVDATIFMLNLGKIISSH